MSVLTILRITEAHFGVGRHTWLATAYDALRQQESLFSAIHLYIWSLCAVKISLLLQYRRIFTSTWMQRVSIAIICFSCTWNVAQSILVSVACVPAANLFPNLLSHCLPPLTIWYIAAAINITTDFVVFLLPIPLIQSLQLPLKQKILLSGVFCLGFL